MNCSVTKIKEVLKILAFISGHKVIIISDVILYMTHLLDLINVIIAQYPLQK
jgi:hypothetical protein